MVGLPPNSFGGWRFKKIRVYKLKIGRKNFGGKVNSRVYRVFGTLNFKDFACRSFIKYIFACPDISN